MLRHSVIFCLLLQLIHANVLDEAARKTCLDEHNHYRAELAKGNVMSGDGKLPSGSDILELEYGQELEAAADKWGQKCVFEHTPDFKYGQNLYWTSERLSPSDALKKATEAWWSEHKHFKSKDLILTFKVVEQSIGHFTQMALAKNRKVGCSVQECQGGTQVICNYELMNKINDHIYTKGTPCKTPSGLCKASDSNSSDKRQAPKGRQNRH